MGDPSTIIHKSPSKKVLVTGGAGFIGSHLTERLLAQGHHVAVVDDESTGDVRNLDAVMGHPRLNYLSGSIADADLLDQALQDVDAVYHLAAAVGVALIARDPIKAIETNIHPTQLLLNRLSERVQRGAAGGGALPKGPICFLASTSEVYGKNPKPVWNEEDDLVFGPTTRPRWSYGASKAIDEFLALAHWRQYELPVVIGRFFNVVGPRQTGAYGMVLPRFVSAALAGQPLVVHDDGQQQRCFAHVDDVVGAVLALMECPVAAGKVFNIGSDRAVTILELARMVIRLANSDSTIRHQSYADAYGTDFEDTRCRVPDLSRLRSAIDYAPHYGLEAIVRQLLAPVVGDGLGIQ